MTALPASLSPDPVAPIAGSTLADVVDRLNAFDVSAQARNNMASGIRGLCRVLDRAPAFVPIHAPGLRRLVGNASPGAIDMSMSRWRNVRSDVNRAIRLSGLSVDLGPEKVPLTEEWEAIALLAPDPILRSVLRRFGRYCSSLQLAPKEVGDETVVRFSAYLDLNQLSRTPERTVKDVIRTWNNHVAVDPTGRFTPLTTRVSKRSYTMSWEELPKALFADARAYMEASLDPGYFDGSEARRPVRPSTAAQRDRMLRRLATAEIRSGVDPAALQSLAGLVEPDRLKPALEFFVERNGGEPNKQVFGMALLALGVARHWARLPEDKVATIAQWMNKVRFRQEGMTEKNRERLRQFANDEVIRSLLTLSDRIVEKAMKRAVNSRSALMVQKALAIALLTVAPLRLDNLRLLDRRRYFRRAFSVDDTRYQLTIPAAEVKNKVDLEFPIPPRIMAMIDLYLETYQPLLTNGHPSTLLFPGRSGQPKHGNALRRNITDVVYKELGLRMNPHLFRHLSALLFLKMNPGQYESVRQLLGHKNIQTTINFYAGFETDEAMHRYGDVINAFRDGAKQ